MGEKDKKDKHTYEDIYPEGLTGVSGGSSGGISPGDIDAPTLLYELGYSFLSKKIPDHYYYDTKPLKTFCNQLVNLFSVDGGPMIVQHQNNDEGYVSFMYGKNDDEDETEGQQELATPKVLELTQDHKKEISNILKDTIFQGSSFAHAWDYYVLGYGVDNITKAHKVRDAFGSQYTDYYVKGQFSVALSKNASGTYLASDVIPDDLVRLFEARRIAIEKQSLRDSFGSMTFDQYIARLMLFKHDLREQYDIELKHRHKKPWKLAILATLIAYTTDDLHEFTTMMMRKAGHLEYISQGMYKNYSGTIKEKPTTNTEGESMVVQKDLMMLPSQISDDLISTFNYRFIEAYHATFSIYSPIPKPQKTGCTAIDEYRHYMYKALKAKRDASLEFEHIDEIDDFEEDQRDNFYNYASDHFDELAKRVAIDLHAIHNDYLLALEPDMLIHQDIFSYTPEQLREYIDNSPASFLKYCAILLYLFSAKTLLEGSSAFERYIDDILHQKQNIFVAESGLNRLYVGENFDNIFDYIEADILVVVVANRRKYIEELISNTEELHDTLAESHESEHNMYLQAMSLLVESDDTNTEKQFLLSTYKDLIEIYRADSQQDSSNDDDNEELV